MVSYLRSYIKSKWVRLRNRSLCRKDCLSLEFIESVRRKEDNGTTDFLLPFSILSPVKGYHGTRNELIPIFSGVELGTWAIDCAAMDYFLDRLDSIKPKVILEYGSGSSTCMFASWMANNNPKGKIVSVEQDENEARRTAARLDNLGFSNLVKVVVLKLDKSGQYIINGEVLGDVLGGEKVDFLFSDGPAGRPGCRINTLPDTLPFMNDVAHWFLHDSLRTPELDILKEWSKIDGVVVEGVVPIGKGIGVGVWRRN